MFNQICIISGGILSLLMVLFHTQFYKRFNWKVDFEKLPLRNQKIFYTIHLALILMFLIFALFSFVYVRELGTCRDLSLGILILYSLFWLWRALWQILYFRPSKSKKHRQLRLLHYGVIVWFFLLFLAYFLPVIRQVLL